MIAMIAGWLMSRNAALTLPYARRLAKIGLAVVAVVLLVAGFAMWLHFHTKAAVEADRSVSNAKAVTRAREADERAREARDRQTQEVSDANEHAEEAAAVSDDPLRAALDSLRAQKDRDRQATGRAD